VPKPLTAGTASAQEGPESGFSKRQKILLFALLAATAALKIAFALAWRGYMTGDDLEIVQTAAKYAAGLPYEPWELRCLFHPIVLVWPLMKPAVLLGASDPATLDLLAALPTILFSTLAVALVAVLALRWGFRGSTALAAAFLYAFAWLPLTFGATPYPRPISTAFLLAAFVLVTTRRSAIPACLTAGVLAGAAFAVRWSEGVILLPLLGWTLWRFRDARRLAAILAGFAAGAALCAGLVDWLTWGRPFASLFAFVRIMGLEMPAAMLEREKPFSWYFVTVLRWAGPVLLLLLLPALRTRRARASILIFASIVVMLSGFGAKEWRYLQGAIPFLAIGAAAGWERIRESGHRGLAAAALLLCIPYGVERSVTLLRDKTAAGIDAARYFRAMRPAPKILALEQTWAYGDRLWLPEGVEIREIEYRKPLRPRAIGDSAAGADVTGVYALHLDRACLRALADLGFRPLVSFRRGTSYECSLFGRGAFAPPRRGRQASENPPAQEGPTPPQPTPAPARASRG
jgi:phosphatidylinositol glycan class B